MIKFIYGGYTLKFQKCTFFYSLTDFLHLLIVKKNLYRDGIRKISNVKHVNRLFIPDFSCFHRSYLTSDGHFTHFTGYRIDCNRFILKIPSINHIRVIRTAKRSWTCIVTKAAALKISPLTAFSTVLSSACCFPHSFPVFLSLFCICCSHFFILRRLTFFYNSLLLFYKRFIRLRSSSNPGMKQNLSGFFHNTKLTVSAHLAFHRFPVLRMYPKIETTALTEYFFQYAYQFVFPISCNSRIIHDHFHSFRFRESNLCRREHIIFQHTVVLKFQQYTGTIYFQEILRSILTG